MEPSKENFIKCCAVTSVIDQKLMTIHNDTSFYSTSKPILEHPCFAELVAMGDRIIPYLFHKILETGSSWIYFHLLKKITGQDPVPKEHWGSFLHHTIEWLTWFSKSKYYKSDIYFGLVSENSDVLQ